MFETVTSASKVTAQHKPFYVFIWIKSLTVKYRIVIESWDRGLKNKNKLLKNIIGQMIMNFYIISLCCDNCSNVNQLQSVMTAVWQMAQLF
jgi:hypothetical protein